jgi:single-strand DNA-binding protein
MVPRRQSRREQRAGAAEPRRISMMNEAHISLTGYVATQPRLRPIREGLQALSMRVAWTPRWLDRATGEWADGNTSYVTVTCWRKLADNAALSLRKGDPVVVKGRLSVRTYDDKEGVSRTQVDVDATSVGHDLCRGVAQFQRTRPPTGQTAAEYATSLGGAGDHGYGTDPGAAGLDETAEPGALTRAGAASGDDGQADREMFDEDAVAALAAEPAGAAAPF